SCCAGPLLGNSGGGRAGPARRLSGDWVGARVGLLLPNLSGGLLAHVRASSAGVRRSAALHHRARNISGNYAEASPHTFRASTRSARIQERISDLDVSPAQAIEGVSRGERFPYPSCSPVSASIQATSVSSQDRAWKK